MANPVQTVAAARSTTTSLTLTFGIAPQSGDLVTVLVGNPNKTTPSVSGLGATWTAIVNSNNSAFDNCWIFAAIVPAGNSLIAVTISSTSNGITGSAQEWAGFQLTTDGTNAVNGNTTSLAPAVTTALGGDLVIAAVTQGKAQTVNAPGSPWSVLDSFDSAGATLNSIWQSGAAATYNPTFSWSSSGTAGAVIAAFKAAAVVVEDNATFGRAVRLQPFARAPLAAQGFDDGLVALAVEETGYVAPAVRWRSLRVQRGLDPGGREPSGAPLVDESPCVTPSAAKGLRLRRPPAAAADELSITAADDGTSEHKPSAFLASLGITRGTQAVDAAPYVAPITDEDRAMPTRASMRRLRLSRAGDEQSAYIAPIVDEPNPPARRPIRALRAARRLDGEALSPIALDENAGATRSSQIQRFAPKRPVSDPAPYVAPVGGEDLAHPRRRLLAHLRKWLPSDEQISPQAHGAEESLAASRPARRKPLRRPSGANEPPALATPETDEPLVMPSAARNPGILGRFAPLNDRNVPADKASFEENSTLATAAPRRRGNPNLRHRGGSGAGDEPLAMLDQSSGAHGRPRFVWRIWRWIWRVGEELGIVLPPARTPRLYFAATLDESIIWAASVDPIACFMAATLNPPIVCPATTDPAIHFAATLDVPVIFGGNL